MLGRVIYHQCLLGDQVVEYEQRDGWAFVQAQKDGYVGWLRAEDLAATAEFFSFGTNDLTQMTYGLSRDDAGRFMSNYVQQGVYDEDPFFRLDTEGVGELLAIAAQRGREAQQGLVLSVCGEHGGDPASIAFCEETGLDYVSASPYRVPIARLAAAQAALAKRKE